MVQESSFFINYLSQFLITFIDVFQINHKYISPSKHHLVSVERKINQNYSFSKRKRFKKTLKTFRSEYQFIQQIKLVTQPKRLLGCTVSIRCSVKTYITTLICDNASQPGFLAFKIVHHFSFENIIVDFNRSHTILLEKITDINGGTVSSVTGICSLKLHAVVRGKSPQTSALM